jgi:hypothetical protein
MMAGRFCVWSGAPAGSAVAIAGLYGCVASHRPANWPLDRFCSAEQSPPRGTNATESLIPRIPTRGHIAVKDEIKNKLSALFAENEKKKQAAEVAQDARQSKEAQFLTAFEDAADNIIEPAMREISELLQANGFHCLISRVQESIDDRHLIRPSDVTLVISRDPIKYYNRIARERHPHFTVFCDKSKQIFQFHESTIGQNTGGHGGSCGEATLETLTKDLLQAKITKTIQDIIHGGFSK